MGAFTTDDRVFGGRFGAGGGEEMDNGRSTSFDKFVDVCASSKIDHLNLVGLGFGQDRGEITGFSPRFILEVVEIESNKFDEGAIARKFQGDRLSIDR